MVLKLLYRVIQVKKAGEEGRSRGLDGEGVREGKEAGGERKGGDRRKEGDKEIGTPENKLLCCQ